MAMTTGFGRCSICTFAFEFDDISSLKCGHTFHQDCITKWINNARNCPKCRTKNFVQDIKKLFVDEPGDLSTIIENTTGNNQINNEMQATIKSLTKQRDEAMNLLEDREMTNNNLKKQLTEEKQNSLSRLKIKDNRIAHLQSLLNDHNAMKHQLETTKRRLKASDFYQMVVKNKGPNEADVDKYIDKFSTANGDPSVGEFLKACRTQANKARKQLNEDLRQERMEKKKLMEQLEKVNKELAESRKRPNHSLIDAPASSKSRARPSLGFSFADNMPSDEFDKENDNSVIEILNDGPFPRPKQLNVSCEIIDDVSNSKKSSKQSNFNDFEAGPSNSNAPKWTIKKPYLDCDELNSLFSPRFLSHSQNSNIRG